MQRLPDRLASRLSLNAANGFFHGVCRDGIDQSDPQRLFGMQLFSGDEQFERAAFSDQPWQPLRPSPAGDES